MSQYIDVEPIFLKIMGGWINPAAIRTVQVYEGNSALLKLLLSGYESPILLTQADSAYIREYLESRAWKATGRAVNTGAQE